MLSLNPCHRSRILIYGREVCLKGKFIPQRTVTTHGGRTADADARSQVCCDSGRDVTRVEAERCRALQNRFCSIRFAMRPGKMVLEDQILFDDPGMVDNDVLARDT